MSWRPDNWKPLDNPDLHSVYEAGADAMLKAVIEFINGSLSERKWEALLGKKE